MKIRCRIQKNADFKYGLKDITGEQRKDKEKLKQLIKKCFE